MNKKILRILMVAAPTLLCISPAMAEDVSLFSCRLQHGGGANLAYAPATRIFTLHFTGAKPESFSFPQARQSVQSWAKGSQTYIVLEDKTHFFGIEYVQSVFEGKGGTIRTSRKEPPQLRECVTSTIKFIDLPKAKTPEQRSYILWDLSQNGITQAVK